jgi:hypothetical protein
MHMNEINTMIDTIKDQTKQPQIPGITNKEKEEEIPQQNQMIAMFYV